MAGSTHWLSATWRASDGRVQFFTSDDGVSWTQLGDDASAVPSGGIFNSTANVQIGVSGATASLLEGDVHYAELRDAASAVVAKYDPSELTILGTRNPTTLVSDTGETWTMNGSAWDWATV